MSKHSYAFTADFVNTSYLSSVGISFTSVFPSSERSGVRGCLAGEQGSDKLMIDFVFSFCTSTVVSAKTLGMINSY